ncbi:MAG TPA: DUF6600 domain-containing protein [Acidobacteriaceae bacterium]
MTNALVSAASAAAFLVFSLGVNPVSAQQAESPAAPEVTAAPAQPASHGPRIVRLSQVNGVVQLDRQTGNGFETAFANLPIVQGSRLRTEEGVAEVEFEDNSSLRLTPNTVVEFPELSLDASGARSSTIHIVQGQIYASMTKSKGNNVHITFGKESLTLDPAAHIALSLSGKQPRLDVFDGTVQAASGGTITTVGHKKGLLFDPANTAPPTLVSKNEKGPFDEWDKHEAEYHQRFAPSGSSNYASVPYAYGLADMNYYGSFASVGGCGSMWRPYLVSSSWSPYANGTWAYYPSAGYSWVSPYPWGWTAFHSGMWNYCPGAGWGWQPNNDWNGLQNTTAIAKLPNRLTQLKMPIGKPRPVGPTVIAVNQKPLVASKLSEGRDTFAFQKDSAGLGVPRGTFGKLNHISNNVMQHGTIERPVFVGSTPNDHGMNNSARAGGNMSTHTIPAGGHSTMPAGGHSGVAGGAGGAMGSHSAPSGPVGGGSHSMGGGGISGGSMSAGGGAMGGGHASSGGHH